MSTSIVEANDCSEIVLLEVGNIVGAEFNNENGNETERKDTFSEAETSELLGKEVKNEEEAFDLYNNYAFTKCFSTRRSEKRKRADGTIRLRTYLCNLAGKKDTKCKENRIFSKDDTRTGCKAKIVFKVNEKENVWTVTDHKMEHNHPFCDPDDVKFLKSHRRVPKNVVEEVTVMKKSGIQVADAYRLLRDQSGGTMNVGFMQKDLYDALQSERTTFSGSDSNTLLLTLKKRQEKEKDFYYDFKLGDDGRLSNIFWRDTRMKEDYRLWGDLLIHDTTYRTNKYDMICGPFVGMNNHGRNVMFGCGFLVNEKIDSFVWLFKTFLKSMDDNQPKTIMTDECIAMDSAISTVFTNARHRLCVWHIMENAKKHVGHLINRKEGFNDKFQYILKCCETEAEFYHVWGRFMDEYKCQNNSWLIRLYGNREKWCKAFSKDFFSGGVISSQRSESTNHSISRKMKKTSTLCEFYDTFCSVILEWRERQSRDDWKCSSGRPDMMVHNVKFLIVAREVYTHAAFKMFQDEFMKTLSLQQEVCHEDHNAVLYTVWQSSMEEIRHMVQFVKQDSSVTCTCKLITELGILCSHCIRILNLRCVQELDDHYMIQRWRRIESRRNQESEANASSSTSRWKIMIRRKIEKILDASEGNAEKRIMCENAVCKLNDEVVTEEYQNFVHEDSNTSQTRTTVLDPEGRRKKGQRNVRMKSTHEKKYRAGQKRQRDSASTLLKKKGSIQSMVNVDEDAQSAGVCFANPILGGGKLTRVLPNLENPINIE